MSAFTGSVQECLRHYVANPRDEKPGDALSSFTGAPFHPTVRRWINGTVTPHGDYLLAIMYFLEDRDYTVLELKGLNKSVKEVGWLIAHKVISIEEAQQAIGYPETSGLRRVLFGRGGTSKARLKKLGNLARQHRQAEGLHLVKAVNSPPKAASGKANGQYLSHDRLLQILADVVKAGLPLAELIVSDAFTAEERKRFRCMVGGDGTFRFSNALNRLCGEKAREVYSQRGPKE